MTTTHCIAASLAVSSILVAAIAACGGGEMDMPPPASGPTQTTSARPSEVDPNLHVTLPAPSADTSQPATKGRMADMPGMNPASQPASSGSMGAMDAGRPMTGMSKPGTAKPAAMGAMDAGMPMDGGMKMGCCGDAPMPMPKAPRPPMPMPMKPHGEGHM